MRSNHRNHQQHHERTQGHRAGTGARRAVARQEPFAAVPGDDPWHETSVVRTLWPPQPGTLRWRGEFGDDLVCVRYRHDARGVHRYTTVEILVDHAKVRTLRSGRKAWQLKTMPHPTDQRMRLALRQAGADWDPQLQAWRLSLTMAKQLGLTALIERVGPSTRARTQPRTKTKSGKKCMPSDEGSFRRQCGE